MTSSLKPSSPLPSGRASPSASSQARGQPTTSAPQEYVQSSSAFALGGLLSTMSSSPKSSPLLPSGSASPSASGQRRGDLDPSAPQEQEKSPMAFTTGGHPSTDSALPETDAPPPEKTVKERIAAIRQRALEIPARKQQWEQLDQEARTDEERRRAEELQRNHKRERSASPTLDLPQKKPALKLQITEEGGDCGSHKLTLGSFQTGVNETNDGQGTDVPQKLVDARDRFGENEKVSKDPKEINHFVLRWYPGSVPRTANSQSASPHSHVLSFEEISNRDHPPQTSSRSRRTKAEEVQKLMVVFSLTDASLSLEATPMSSTWQQYGDVKDVVDELTSGQQCTFTVTVGTELHGANRYATQMLLEAYKKRFRPLFTYNQQSFRPTVTLDLRLKTTVKEIGDALERHLPSAKVWRDGGSGDIKWTPVQLFDLPKHLNSLLHLGIRIKPEGAGDKSTGNLNQGSLGTKGLEKAVEEAEEGSEEGEILG